MDDKVLKLLDRAIADNLSYNDVESIMSYNGYDQSSIEQALSELKKKRPELVSDVPSASENPAFGAFDVPTSEVEPSTISDSDGGIPDDLSKADYVNDREILKNFADQQAQLAQDLNNTFRDADPDPLNFFESAYQRGKGFVTGQNFGIGLTLGNINEDIERAKQQEEFDNDIEAQKALREERLKANAAINDHFGGEYNLYEEDEDGILRANPEKKEEFKGYLDAVNAQSEYIRSNIAIEDAIKAENEKNKTFFDPIYEPFSAPVLSAMTFGQQTVSDVAGVILDAVGAPEKYAGNIGMGAQEMRATAKIRAGLDPKDERSFTELFEEGEIGAGSKLLGLTLAEQLPQIAMAIVQPEIGLSTGAVSAGASSYMSVRNRLDMSVADKITTTAVSGAAEYLFEKVSMTDIKLARKALGIDEAVDAASAATKKQARTKALKELRKEYKMRPLVQTGEQFLSEGLEEVGVEMTNNMLSYMISGEVGEPRDMLESFIIGGIMGGGTVAIPHALASGLNGLATKANMKEFKEVTDRIQELQGKLGENMSEYDKQKVQDEIIELGQKQQQLAGISKDIYKAMPKEAQLQMFDLHKDMNKALAAYKDLKTDQAKKQQLGLIRDLISDKEMLEAEYGHLSVSAKANKPGTMKMAREYRKELNDSNRYSDGVVKPGKGVTKREARYMNNIFGILSGDKKPGIVVHNSLQSLINANKKAREIYLNTNGKKFSAAYVVQGKNGDTVHVLSPEAYRKFNQHRSPGKQRSASKTYAHEIIHPAIEQMLKTDPIAQERLFSEIETLANEGNVFAKEAMKFSEKYTADQGFDDNTRKNETLTEFLALMTQGNNLESIKRDNPGFIQKLKEMINDILVSMGIRDIRIEDDADLVAVAENLSNAMRLGSKIKFGQDIQKESVQKAKKAKKKETDSKANLNRIAFALLDFGYQDADKRAEVLSMFADDNVFIEEVQRRVDNESLSEDVLEASSITQEERNKLNTIISKLNDFAQQNTPVENSFSENDSDADKYEKATEHFRKSFESLTEILFSEEYNSLVNGANYHIAQRLSSLADGIISRGADTQAIALNSGWLELEVDHVIDYNITQSTYNALSAYYEKMGFIISSYDLDYNTAFDSILDALSGYYSFETASNAIQSEVSNLTGTGVLQTAPNTTKYKDDIDNFERDVISIVDEVRIVSEIEDIDLASQRIFEEGTRFIETLNNFFYEVIKPRLSILDLSEITNENPLIEALAQIDRFYGTEYRDVYEDEGLGALVNAVQETDLDNQIDDPFVNYDVDDMQPMLSFIINFLNSIGGGTTPTVVTIDPNTNIKESDIDVVKKEAKELLIEIQQETTDSDNPGDMVYLSTYASNVLNGYSPLGFELDSSKYPNLIKAYSQYGENQGVMGASFDDSTIFQKIFYLAAAELNRDGAPNFTQYPNDVIATKFFRISTPALDEAKRVGLIPPGQDMFTTEFKLQSPLINALAPENLKMRKATPDQWMALFAKSTATSQEAEFIDLRGWLNERYNQNGRKTISAEEVQNYVRNNIVTPSVSAPYGTYMWSKAEYDPATGEMVVPIMAEEEEAIDVGTAVENAVASWNNEYEQFISDVMSSNEPSDLYYLGRDIPFVIAASVANVNQENYYHEGLEFGMKLQDGVSGFYVKGTLFDEDYPGDEENIDIDTFVSTEDVLEALRGYIEEHSEDIELNGSVLSASGLEIDFGYTPSQSEIEEAPREIETTVTETKTFKLSPGQTKAEALDYARKNYGTSGRMALGKFGSYSIQDLGRVGTPGPIINYAEFLVRVPNSLTQKQGVKPFVQFGHYREENVAVHLRLGEGADTQGNRILFIDEIQSDWGQNARRGGQMMNPFLRSKAYEAWKKMKAHAASSSANGMTYADLLNDSYMNIHDVATASNDIGLPVSLVQKLLHAGHNVDSSSTAVGSSLGLGNITDPNLREEAIIGASKIRQEIFAAFGESVDRLNDLTFPVKKSHMSANAYDLLVKDPLSSEFFGLSGLASRMDAAKEELQKGLSKSQKLLEDYLRKENGDEVADAYKTAAEAKMQETLKEFDNYIETGLNKILAENQSDVNELIADEKKLISDLGMPVSEAVELSKQHGNTSKPTTPFNPWNQNNRWVNMALRVATQLAVNGGFDYVAWTPGDIQSKRWSGQEGLAKFYNNTVPSIAKKEMRRFDKKAAPKPIKMRNRMDDITSGSFDVLAIPMTDKIVETFKEGGATSFSLDTDMSPQVPDIIKDSPANITSALKFADGAKGIENKIQFKEELDSLIRDEDYWSKIKEQYGLTMQKGVDGKDHIVLNNNAMEYVADMYEYETLVALKAYPDALGWYDETVSKALKVMSLIHPEIGTDKQSADTFKMAVAITSNGNKVIDNFVEANRQYEYFKKNGKFDQNKSIGTQSSGILASFKLVNNILEIMSMENLVEFMTTRFRAGDLKYKDRNGKVKTFAGGFVVDQEVYGASILGPKIGNGFFMNLYGVFSELTMDRWFMRQFGRFTGSLLAGRNVKNTEAQKKRFISAIKKLKVKERKLLSTIATNILSDPYFKLTGKDNDVNFEELARHIVKLSMLKVNRENVLANTKYGEGLNEVRKAANGWVKNLEGEKEAPAGGKERQFLIRTADLVKERLMAKYGISIDIADFQAVNWYPEKALYKTFQDKASISSAKSDTSEDEKPDYFSASTILALKKGVKQEDIDNEISKLKNNRNESIRETIRSRNEESGTGDQEVDIEQLQEAIKKVARGEEIGKTFFHLDSEFEGYTQGSELGDVTFSSMQPHVTKAKTYLERRMTEMPMITLEGPDAIRSASDIAFLMRHMESLSAESTFLVVNDKNDPSNYDVTYMTTGTVSSAMVDPLKIRQIVTNFQEQNGPDTEVEICLVHNHPSGALIPSGADQAMHVRLQQQFDNDKKVFITNSIIINLDSGRYTQFSKTYRREEPYDEVNRGNLKKVEVKNFDRQVLYRPRGTKDLNITNSRAVAQHLSYFKVSPETKLGYVALTQANNVSRIALLDAGASSQDLSLMIERTIGRYGNGIILFGNDKAALKSLAINIFTPMEQQNVRFLDAVYYDSGRPVSMSDMGNFRSKGSIDRFSLEEVSEGSLEDAMSIPQSMLKTEFDAQESPLFRRRKVSLPDEEKIQSVINSHQDGKRVLAKNYTPKSGDLMGVRLNLNLVGAGQKKYGERLSILSLHVAKNQKNTKYKEVNGKSVFGATEEVMANTDVVVLKNAYFNVHQKKTNEVGTYIHKAVFEKMDKSEVNKLYPKAQNKNPFASVDGQFVETAREDISLDGIMVKFNPTNSHMFMDVTGRPIVFAEEVTMMGDRAYARGTIRYADKPLEQVPTTGIGTDDFVVPSIVTTDAAKVESAYESMMENGIAFTIEEDGYESHNILDESSLRMRQTAKRFADSLGDADADVRQKIIDNPENYINKQKLEEIKDILSELSDEEIVEAMSDNALVNVSLDSENANNNIFVLAAIERINRMQANGEDTSDAIEQLAKVGTTVGRMLRQFAELKTSTPVGIVQMIESAMSKAGRRMTDVQRQRLMKVAKDYMDAQRALIDHQSKLGTLTSKEFSVMFTELASQLDKQTKVLNKMTGVLIPKTYGSLFGTFIKGNLMSPVSLITNVTANVFEQVRFMAQRPVEGLVHTISYKASRLVSKFLGREVGITEYYGREMGVTMLALPYALKRGAIGFMEATKGLFVRGQETEKIIHTGLQPMYSLYAMLSDTKLANMINKATGKDLIKGDILPRDKQGNIKAGDRAKLFIEGVFGIAPDIVFRFLPMGDKPFSYFSSAFVVYNEAVKRFGLAAADTDEFQNFLKYPPQDVVKKMTTEGERATFQENNKAAQSIYQFRKIVEGKGKLPGKMMSFLFDSFMPYVKTPANIFVSTLKIAMPGIGTMSAMYNYSQGNAKKANEDLSMAIVGTMMIKAADLLIAGGAIIGAFTDEDKEEKSLEYLMHGPMVINISSIRRYLSSFDPEDLKEQEGDSWSKLDKMGIIGVVMGARATATKGLKFDKDSKKNTWYSPGEEPMFDTSFIFNYFNPEMLSGTFKFINSMSFLQGANSLLSLISGDAEGYDLQRNIDNWFRSITSVALPGTISAINRAQRPYMPIFRNKDVGRRMLYILRDKTVNTDVYPPRIDLVGRKIKQTPEGKNPYYYHLASVYKTKTIDTHPVVNEYYRLMVATEDGSWLPSAPSKLTSYFYNVSRTDVGNEKYAQISELAGKGNKAKIRFEEEELVKLQQLFFQDLTKNVEMLMKEDRYVNAEDDEKVELIKSVISYTKKPVVTTSRDKFGATKAVATWYKAFQDMLPEKVDGLLKQQKESE